MPTPACTCACCDGVAHPASGCQYSERVVVCGPCTRRFWAWAKRHTSAKGRRKGPNFYDHVTPLAEPGPVLESTSHSPER